MKNLRIPVLASLLCAALAVSANDRPLPLSPTYLTPAPAGYSVGGAAFEGDWMIVSGGKINTVNDAESPMTTAAVFLYRRGGLGNWTFQAKLAEIPYFYDWNTTGISLAMESGLLVFEMGGSLHIYERAAVGYAQTAMLDGFSSVSIRIDGQRILAGLGNCPGAAVVQKNTAGVWAISSRLLTTGADCQDDYQFTDHLDISGDYALVATRSGARTTQAFRRTAGQANWPKVATLPGNDMGFANTAVGLRGSLALLSGNSSQGTRLFQRASGTTTWTQTDTLRTIDQYSNFQGHVGAIRQRSEWWLLDRDLWRQNSDNSFDHVARIDTVSSEDVGGRTILGWKNGSIATYILPATLSPSPTPLRDDFQGGGNITWQINGFTYAQSGFTRVLRNSQTTMFSEAIAVDSDWQNQSFQVDVSPAAFRENSSFIALALRRTDAGNFYQARFMQNRVTLVRRSSGGDVQLANAGVPFTTNRNYRVRFDARGKELRVFVDGALIISISDGVHTHGGVSLHAFEVIADFDNVVVSPIATRMFEASDMGYDDRWTPAGGTWTDVYQSTPRTRRQTDRTVVARSLIGVADTDDQIIETGVRIDSLPPTGDRWVGVIARYRDNSNFYYASLRVGGGVQIVKIVSGTATVLASVPYAVRGNFNYRLRLEVVGDQLRAYAGDVFVAEAHDATFATGRFGVATSLAAASFFQFDAFQP